MASVTFESEIRLVEMCDALELSATEPVIGHLQLPDGQHLVQLLGTSINKLT